MSDRVASSTGDVLARDVPNIAWYINKPLDVDGSQLGDFLDTGAWTAPEATRATGTLATLSPGHPIALKSVVNRKTGLPFFNADRPAAVMTIYATGMVRSVDFESGTVEIAWRNRGAARKWYFYTSPRPVWQVRPTREHAAALLDFTFNDAEQDIGRFLTDPFWASRYRESPDFSWIPFYSDVATKLRVFAGDRTPLLEGLMTAAVSEAFLTYLTHDRFADGTMGPMRDIDPFTVFGTFNRGMTDENRTRVAGIVGAIVGSSELPPTSFDGIPLVNNQRSWFVQYDRERKPDAVGTLWDTFDAALEFAGSDTVANRKRLAAAYDTARTVWGVKWNLSQAFYWIRPKTFATLEGQSRAFIPAHFKLPIPQNGVGYVDLLDRLNEKFDSGTTSIDSFPLLSFAAWARDEAAPQESTIEVFADWAARMAEWVDLDTEENSYKRATADMMRQARDECRAGESMWPATFRRALSTADNLLHYMFKDDVARAVAADPTTWAEILGAVWDEPVPASLDVFRDGVRRHLAKATPGNVTGLGALLLMADDADTNAPYLTSRTEKWYRMTGSPGPTDLTSPTDRYATMLAFLDRLASVVEETTGFATSRLEAQSLAWITTESPIPTEWDDGSRTALERYRGSSSNDEPPRAWYIRPKGVDFEDWLEDEYVSVNATWLGVVEPGSDQKVIKEAVEAGYQQVEPAERQALTIEFFDFLTKMRTGDLVCSRVEGQLHIGRIVGDARYDPKAKDDRLRRDVRWLTEIAADADLPSALTTLLSQQGTIVELTDSIDVVYRLLELPPADQAVPAAVVEAGSVAVEATLPSVADPVADSLHMDRADLQGIVDLLAARKQIVLYGPPGTGKTFIAIALARSMVGEDNTSHHQLVQFHPSYAYEDFFEGYRPIQTASGQPGFELVDGPLRRIAREARKEPGLPFVLIIDEMNRANLAKVFGELYFLLEYRDHAIRLQYNPTESFRLPPNLYLIGTMNTADRSIALLDAAMRRRFAFVELHPDEPPVRDVLARFLAAQGLPHDPRAAILAALNDAIQDSDRDFKIGPSYLMRPEAGTDTGLDLIWRHDVLPLLEEHYYGRLSRGEIHLRFGLTALRQASTASTSTGSEFVVPTDDVIDRVRGE